ncbi:MAG: hypothetical protein JHD16_06160 [Solirubrobacteraceae bacterium]|nr:hypothetical protein [Solirubrobacteraceae bacterium]
MSKTPSLLSHAHPWKTVAAGVLAGLALGLIGAPASSAAPKQYLTIAKDPTGDGPTPSRDIIETIARYKSDGSILFVVTLNGPVDPVANDAAVSVSLGTSCNTVVGLGVGLLSEPDVVEFAAVSNKNRKISNPRTGRGAITNNVFTFLVKHPSIAGWTPRCYAIALLDPSTPEDEAPVLFDQTGEVKLSPRK